MSPRTRFLLKTALIVTALSVAWTLLAEAAFGAPRWPRGPVVIKDVETGNGRLVEVGNPTGKKVRVVVTCRRGKDGPLAVWAESVISPKRRVAFDLHYAPDWSDRDVQEQGLRAGDCKVASWEHVQ